MAMAIVRLRQDSVRVLPFVGKDEKAQCIYWDEETEGFGVRVYSSSHRSYVVTYHLVGQKRTPTLGRVDVMTLQAARALAKSYIGAAAVGKDPEAAEDLIERARRPAFHTVAKNVLKVVSECNQCSARMPGV